jgi:hypothetical protein
MIHLNKNNFLNVSYKYNQRRKVSSLQLIISDMYAKDLFVDIFPFKAGGRELPLQSAQQHGVEGALGYLQIIVVGFVQYLKGIGVKFPVRGSENRKISGCTASNNFIYVRRFLQNTIDIPASIYDTNNDYCTFTFDGDKENNILADVCMAQAAAFPRLLRIDSIALWHVA